jgi:NAD-dependent protein deacetylase/lipoamidase
MLSCPAMQEDVRRLAEILKRAESGLILAVTGAGVSAPSGLPTFRGKDPGAIWNRDVTEMGTRHFFERDPVTWWTWFLDRFEGLDAAEPNAAHRALAALERWQVGRGGDFLLVTQNIDTLHEQAGSRRLVKVHGSSDRLRCSRAGCRLGSPLGSLPSSQADLEAFRREPSRAALPRCPACGALLRAHVLLFDEYYDEHADYGFDRVEDAAERVALVLFAGTSFSVGVTDFILRSALGWRVPVISIDPAAEPPFPGITGFRAPAEEILPAACRELGVEVPL